MRSILVVLVTVLLAVSAQGQAWLRAQPVSSPAPRDGHAMAWDSARETMILFGGYDWGPNRHYRDHWEYDGSTWTQRSVGTAPSARTRAGMCYDERRGVVVLFGGMFGDGLFTSPTYFGDTWEFDGTTWRQVFPTGSVPTARITELAYDSARGVVVMFGGYGDGAPFRHNDTWEYDGERWTQRTSLNAPPARPDYAIAYDRKRQRLVAQPGYILGHSTQMVTWEWDGNDWTATAAATLPPPFPMPSMTYDRRRECVVLVGSTFSAQQQTWEFDGNDWTRSSHPAPPIVGISGHRVAYDPRRATVVLFGGEIVSGAYIVSSNATWEYARLASYEAIGTGCALVGPPPTLIARPGGEPRSGSMLAVEVSGLGARDQPFLLFGAGLVALELSVIGLPGCDLVARPDLAIPLVNQTGRALWSLRIPSDPRLHGATFYNQALVLDPALPVAITNGAVGTIGR